MKIKLRGKIWKQITKEEFVKLNEDSAVFQDWRGERTYFREIKIKEKTK